MKSQAIDTNLGTQAPPEMAQAVIGHEKRPGSGTGTAAEQPELPLMDQVEHLLASSTSTDDVVPTTKLQFLVIFIALILAIFCVALDNTIIVTAIPRITDDYKTLNDVGWYVEFLAAKYANLLSSQI